MWCARWGAVAALALAPSSLAEHLHIVIPAGPGGGLDGTAREAGRVLRQLELIDRVSYENVSGGGGGRAMAYFIENAARFDAPLLVNSTPLVLRSLQGLFPFSFRDLTPVAALVADYGVFVVPAQSEFADWPSVVAALRENPRALKVGGGSVRGSLDHIVLALALQSAGVDARTVRYLPYDGGGKAMLALLGGEVDLLSTGLGESIGFLDAERATALAVTAPQRIPAVAAAPTLVELGYDVTFANWRGLFGPPGMSDEARDAVAQRLAAMAASAPWQEVLRQRGWAPIVSSGDAFGAFLEAQETVLADTMRDLGLAPKDDR